MAQKPIEVILTRQLAASLAMPVFLVDVDGTLLFYNEPAERVLGIRFEETGELPAAEWATLWSPSEESGEPIPPERVPLMTAVGERRPAHGTFWIGGLDGRRRHIEVTAFPLVRPAGQVLGAVAIFWETGR